MASFITSYAKQYLVTAINFNKDRFMYCDTDSVHLYGSLEEVKGIKIGKKIYRYWDNELCFDDFKYLGSKRYAERNVERGKWEIKCCGLTDKIMKRVDIQYFDYCPYTIKELNRMVLYTKESDDDVYYYEDKECTKVIKGLFKSKKARIVPGGTLIITTPYAIIDFVFLKPMYTSGYKFVFNLQEDLNTEEQNEKLLRLAIGESE